MGKDMLKEERIKILDMLGKGIITAAEAETLLEALGGKDEAAQTVITQKKAPFRMLKIFVNSKDGDVVKVQIPIEFAKLLKSKKFNINLENTDVDIDQLIDMIHSGVVGEIVNIESSDGDIIKIVVE